MCVGVRVGGFGFRYFVREYVLGGIGRGGG